MKKSKAWVSEEDNNDEKPLIKRIKIVVIEKVTCPSEKEVVVTTEKEVAVRTEKEIEMRTKKVVADLNEDKPTTKVITPPTTIAASVKEADIENPTKQIFGIVKDIRTS